MGDPNFPGLNRCDGFASGFDPNRTVSLQHLGAHVTHDIKHGAFGDSGFAKFRAERMPPIMETAVHFRSPTGAPRAGLRDVTGRAGSTGCIRLDTKKHTNPAALPRASIPAARGIVSE